MKKLLISILACALILAVTVNVVLLSVVAKLKETVAESESEPKTVANSARVSRVEVMPIELTTVEDSLRLTGSVYPWEDVTVSAETSGKIEWQGVRRGRRFARGRNWCEWIPRRSGRRWVKRRRRRSWRIRNMTGSRISRAGGVAAQRELDAAVANMEVADASLLSLEIQLRKSVVSSPVDGVVDRLPHEEKEFVDVGAPLARIVQVDKVKVVVGIPERDIPFFSEGDAVRVKLDAMPERVLDGTIHEIATTAEMTTHTFSGGGGGGEWGGGAAAGDDCAGDVGAAEFSE